MGWLQDAISNGDAPRVKSLIETGADIEEREFGATPLHTAIDSCNVEIVRILLEFG